MKYFNCPMSSSLFSCFQGNTKYESSFFADTCTRRVPIFRYSVWLKLKVSEANSSRISAKGAFLRTFGELEFFDISVKYDCKYVFKTPPVSYW
jgi:hypothetical protein